MVDTDLGAKLVDTGTLVNCFLLRRILVFRCLEEKLYAFKRDLPALLEI